MNAVALNLVPQGLRVMIAASSPQRVAALTRLVQGLGHFVVPMRSDASVVLTDNSAPSGGLPIVALGSYRDDAQGRLPSDASPEQIDAALRAVSAGLRVTVAGETKRSFAALDEGEPRVLLTPRETEVLNAAANGLTNKEIARELGISLHTVKFHLESVMRKIGVSSRTEAVSKAMWLGLLEPFRV
jgi:DNA-binding NarL/FixJ family response regulator